MQEEHHIDREILFFRYAAGLASEIEKSQVEELIAGSPEMAGELDAVREALKISRKIHEMESYDIHAGYRELRDVIKKTGKRKQLIRFLSRAAAILTIPLLITTLTFGYLAFHKTPEEIVYAEVVSAPGLISRFELPDKSKVWLNSNAMLRYPVHFNGKAREVELEGEGYFEVQSDKEHPFYVKTTSGTKIMAYGTRFNVNAGGELVEAVLAEGKVAVSYGDQLQEVNPGEKISIDSKTKEITIEEVNLYEKLAWKDGKIIFRNAPLNEVFDQLSKRYNVDIILHDEYNQSGRYLSRVTFTDETIQQIFSYLEIAAPIEWKISAPVKNNDSTLTKQRIEVWLKKK
ncbi:MAG: FecR domain-containing protein [Tannerella sp.]|jgi:ferric-dicitrate binding protein FerR (iron transport regulator)|nr:FecR domain-containing protein [Tannerella sp.]